MEKTEKVLTLPTRWVVTSIVIILILGITMDTIFDSSLAFFVLCAYILALFIFHIYQNRKKILSLITEKDKKLYRILLYIVIGSIILVTVLDKALK